MLRDEPITGSEAREITGFVSDLLRHSRAMARILPMLSKTVDVTAIESTNKVLEKFKRCVDLAAEKDISFKIDF